MRELNRQARSLIAAAGREAADDPSLADRARVRHGLKRKLAGASALGASTVGIGAAKAVKLTLVSKLLLPTALATLGTVGGGYAYRASHPVDHAGLSVAVKVPTQDSAVGPGHSLEPLRSPTPSQNPAAEVLLQSSQPSEEPVGQTATVSIRSQPRIGAAAAGVERRATTPPLDETHARPNDELPSTNGAAEGARTDVRPSDELNTTKGPVEGAQTYAKRTLEAETRLLREAHAELRRGNARQALNRLSEYDRQFGRGMLRAEYQAARVLALCQMGQREQARREGQAFLEQWPNSPLLPRIRAACTAP